VLLDYERLRGPRLTPLASLNDSKQLLPEERERLFHAVLRLASQVSVQVVSPGEIDRTGLHRSNLRALAAALRAVGPTPEVRLVDGFRLGPTAPPHRAVVDGDQKSAAVAAASVIAKVVRDRAMRRLDALYPAFGFVSHVGYITPSHSAVVRRRGPCALHRRSFQALCYVEPGVGVNPEVDAVPADIVAEAIVATETDLDVVLVASSDPSSADAGADRRSGQEEEAAEDASVHAGLAAAEAESTATPTLEPPLITPTARSRAA
jgi:ribonuclease HII